MSKKTESSGGNFLDILKDWSAPIGSLSSLVLLLFQMITSLIKEPILGWAIIIILMGVFLIPILYILTAKANLTTVDGSFRGGVKKVKRIPKFSQKNRRIALFSLIFWGIIAAIFFLIAKEQFDANAEFADATKIASVNGTQTAVQSTLFYEHTLTAIAVEKSQTPTQTSSLTPTLTLTSTPTVNPMPTFSFTPTFTATHTPTLTPSPTPFGGSSEIIFEMLVDGDLEIVRLDIINEQSKAADKKKTTNLTNNPANDFDPMWSPDGQQIVFVSDRDGNQDIFILDEDGQRNLTNSQDDESEPSWSPDGSKIAFVRVYGNYEIYVIDSKGENIECLTENLSGDFAPFWVDNENIHFISLVNEADCGTRCNYSLYNININTKKITKIKDNIGDLKSVSAAPDGTTFTYVANYGSSSSFHSNLYIRSIDGTNTNLLSNFTGSELGPSFSPDGTQLAFILENNNLVRSIRIIDLYSKKGAGDEIFIGEMIDNISWKP